MTSRTLRNGLVGWSLAAMTLLGGGCGNEPPPAAHDESAVAQMPTNRVAIPATVRENLGITFATVEQRPVSSTLRLPGRFELLPTAKREYRTPLPGLVEVQVEQYETVEAGEALYRLDSPRWRELQRELSQAAVDIRQARAGVESIGPFFEAHEKHHEELERAVALWEERVARIEQVQAAGGARADEVAQARAALAMARATLAETLEKEAELVARRIETNAALEAAEARFALLLETAAALTGVAAAELEAPHESGPRWASIGAIEVRAVAAGVVDAVHVTSGGWAEEHESVVVTVQPDRVRFRGKAVQSDADRIPTGAAAKIVGTGGRAGVASLRAELRLAPTADAESRTIDVLATPLEDAGWARAGVAAFVEVATSAARSDELAIPLSCVVRDGTRSIIFRRDPSDPDQVIRMEADLGADDGRWIVVRSGVREGDEIVLDGVYQLMAATSGSVTKGGHFHPDGTFHEGHD